MNFIPSLKNFKDLLGNVNDGNVVFTQDGQGLEKANHGNAISRKIYNYRQVPSNPNDNARIRNMLMDAISNSSEGRALSQFQLNAVRGMLGIGSERTSSDDLTRVELKLVLDAVELMVRGESPDQDAKRIQASLKGIPSVDNNLLVQKQVDKLASVGYGSNKFQRVVAVAKELTQTTSKLFSEDTLDRLFAKGFEGHSKKEMVLFARNSAAHIQSQVFDKIFWKCADVVDGDPNAKSVTFNAGTTKSVFLEVIHEMTTSWAAGKEPLPKTDSLLHRSESPDPVAPPKPEVDLAGLAGELLGDPLKDPVAMAGAKFLEETCGRVDDVLYGDQIGLVEKFNAFRRLSDCDLTGADSSRLFMLRQMKSLASQIGEQLNMKMQLTQPREDAGKIAFRRSLYETFKRTYDSTPGTVPEKKQAAVDAVNRIVTPYLEQYRESLFGGAPVLTALNAFDMKFLSACLAKPKVASGVFVLFADALARNLADGTFVIDPPTLGAVVDRMREKLDELLDMGPIARSLAVKIGFAKTNEAVVGKIRDVLGNLPKDFVRVVDEIRFSLAEDALTDPNANIDALAGAKVTDVLADKVRVALGNVADPAAIAQEKKRLFEAAAGVHASYNKDMMLADSYVLSRQALQEEKTKVQNAIVNVTKRRETSVNDLNKLEDELKTLLTELSALKADDPAYKAKSDLVEAKRKAVESAREKVEKAEISIYKSNKELKDLGKYDEAYYNIVEKDLEFRGKLVLACQCGLLDNRPELKALITAKNGMTKVQPEGAARLRDELNVIFADKSLPDLKLMTGYVADGFSAEDGMNKGVPGVGRWVFRDMYLDGRLDFSNVAPKTRAYLMTGITSHVRGTQDSGINFNANELDKDTFEAFYRELREGLIGAVNKANQGKSKAGQYKLEDVLRQSDLADKDPPDHAAKDINMKFHHTHCYVSPDGKSRLSIRMFKCAWGFGSGDPAVVRDTLARVGLKQADLNTPAGWLKAHRLSMIIWAHGGKASGAVEWAERVTGKAFDDIRLGDLIGIVSSKQLKEAIPDPMDDLKDDTSTVARFLSGQITLDEANLKPDEMPNFLDGLRNIAAGTRDSAEVSLFGKNFTVSKCPNGVLTAKLDVGGGKMMSINVARPLAELIGQVENQAVNHADRFTSAQILSILPKPPTGNELTARPRELYSKTLSTLLGLPSVNFAHLSTRDLYDTVRRALDPQTDRKALAGTFETLPTSYNSAETVELQAKLLQASEVDLAAVKLPKRTDARTPAEKARAFLSELVMNEDTWAYDTGMKTPGQRILSLVEAFGDDIAYLRDNSNLLEGLPAILRDDVGGILEKLYTLVGELGGMDGNQAKLDACAALEKDIDAFVKTSIEKMQVEATELFGASQGDKRENWQKGLSEMGGTDGLSESTSQGRFTKKVLDNYFVSCDPIEKRAMLANILRNTDKDSSRGKLVGEMLKGAGPLLQKTLQGLSANTFGPETQIALKDMKSKLLPISDSVIQANLLELVRSSNGEILSIEVKKSLGQATVGQALLCHIRTKSHPVSGEDVVIKILRPNVQTAVRREYKTFLDIARKLDAEEHTGTSQQETFKGRYQTVLKEFDFTLESANIDLCRGVYEVPTAFFGKDVKVEKYGTIHSMDRHHSVSPMSGVLLLQKVEGKPVDRLLEDSRAAVEEIVSGIKQTTQLGDDVKTKKTVYRAATASQALDAKYKLWNRRAELIEQHKELTKLVDIWMEKALFGDGVFHNDLHPGNVMINGLQVSVIDFGNVGRLNKDQQNSLVFLFAAAMTGNVDDYVKGVEDLLGEEIKEDPKNVLKTALTDVFAKGSSADVLARMLAALSVLKDNSFAIPEVIHNFAESMARLQSVVDGVVDEILTVETISNQITLKDGNLGELKLDPKWNGIHFEALDELKTVLKSLGTPEKPFDSAEFVRAAKRFVLNFEPTKVDPKTKKVVFQSKEYNKSIEKTLVEKVFTQQDGGIAFLTDVAKMLRDLPNVKVSSSSDLRRRVEIKSTVENFEIQLHAYSEALASEQAVMIKDAKKGLVSQFSGMFYGIMSIVSRGDDKDPNYGPMIFDSVAPDRFVSCVSNALSKRTGPLSEKVAAFYKIPKDDFDEIMESFVDENKPLPVWKSLKYAKPLFSLKGIKDRIEAASDVQDKVETLMRFFAWKGHGLTEAELEMNTIGDPLTMLESEKVRSCAWEFRYPQSWTPAKKFLETDKNFKARVKKEIETRDDDKENSVKGAGGIKEMRLVFKTNLDALKKALGVEALTVRQIAYFAQMSVATTRYQPFGELLVGYNDDKLAEIAGGDADLKLYLTKLQSSVNAVINQENEEAARAKKK